MAKNRFGVKGLVACEGGWECCVQGCEEPWMLGWWITQCRRLAGVIPKPQDKPAASFSLEYFHYWGWEGVYKSRLKGVTGKYLKIFLYENSHGLTDGDECKIGKNLECKCETSKNFILGIFWLQLYGTLLPSPLDSVSWVVLWELWMKLTNALRKSWLANDFALNYQGHL